MCDAGRPGISASMEAGVLNDSSKTDRADGEDDGDSTALLEADTISIPSVRSRHRRRKAMQAAKQRHDDGVEGHASVVTPTLHHKAVQTEVVTDTGEESRRSRQECSFLRIW